MIARIITSKYLYPLWRIGWLERAFFHACRLFQVIRPSAFLEILRGFDISKYQGVVDFLKMLAFGAKFLILRCGYAVTKDERFEEYISAAHGILPLAVYHFYDPVFDPVQQAKKVIAILEPHRHKIRRVWLDFEFWWSGAFSHPKHWKTYKDTIKAAGYEVGIYTRATWWDSRVGEYASEFGREPLWAAQYNTVLNLIPKGWSKAAMWQRGTPAIGLEAGVSSKEIDDNLWNDEFNFVEEWGFVDHPPQDGGAMLVIKGKAKGTVRRRNAPVGMEFNPPRYLFVNDEIEASENQQQWLKLSRINSQAVQGEEWVSAGAQQQYIEWHWETIPDPTPNPEPTPEPTPEPPAKLPFTFEAEGFKPFNGELERE